MNRTGVIAAVLVVLGIPAAPEAFSIAVSGTHVMRWPSAAMTYYLDPNDAPGVKDGSTVPTLKQCFADWQAVACTGATFQYLGSTANKSVLPVSQDQNGKNEVVWINTSAWTFGEMVLGVTVPLSYGDGGIVESDIALNGYLYKWNTQGQIGWNEMDVRSVAIHEMGHFFGLQHVLSGYDTGDPPTMAVAVDPYGATASLSQDDMDGICFLYPKSGYYACTTDSQCPKIIATSGQGQESYDGQLTCKNGNCYDAGISGISPGSVANGGVCSLSTDCKSPASCQVLDTSYRICTRNCTPSNDDCAVGMKCGTMASVSGNWCIPGAKKLTEGDKCSVSSECSTSFCFPRPDRSGASCRIACNKNGAACPDDKVCWSSPSSTAGGCFPADQVPHEQKSLGWDCVTDADCTSGICGGLAGAAPICLQWCASTTDCYQGYVCSDIGGRMACVVQGKTDDGASCTADGDCASGWCLQLIGTAQSDCRSPCNLSDWKCPEGTACVSYGDPQKGACMPIAGKLDTGSACQSGADCVSGICFTDSATGLAYCTQNCVDSWCPGDLACVNGEDWGNVCALPAGTLPEVVEPTQAESDPDATGAGDEGQPATSPAKNGSGCASTGPASGTGVWLLLAGLLSGLARRRGRGGQALTSR